MIVRKLVPHEFDVTVNLFNYYFDEAVTVIPSMAEEFDQNSISETIKHYATHYDYCWFNSLDNSRPVGFIAGYATECPWNNSIITANIAFVYLLESHRNIDNFRLLLSEFEQWARLIKATRITGGDIGINAERMEKLYSHFGFKKALFMIKEFN